MVATAESVLYRWGFLYCFTPLEFFNRWFQLAGLQLRSGQVEHSHRALGIDLDSFSEVINGQLVLTKILIHETSLDPYCLILPQLVNHNR